MDKPFILHILTSEKNVSPFDVNMAVDAGWERVIPYTGVEADEVQALVQDTIFSRGPSGVKRTGVFIGGRDMFTALEMLDTARKSMVSPFEISVFADPSGAFTTAAGMIVAVEKHLKKGHGADLAGCKVLVMGGTGPVGTAVAVLAAEAGAEVFLLSRKMEKAQAAVDRCASLLKQGGQSGQGGAIHPGDNDTKARELPSADVALAVAAAGIQVMSEEEVKAAAQLKAAADVNAVPPSGIAGVDVQHDGAANECSSSGALSIGALAIGNVKYQSQHRLLKKMREAGKPLSLHFEHACDAAREYVAEHDG